MVRKFQTWRGIFIWNQVFKKIGKMECHYYKFYIVFKQAVLYLDLWRFGRTRVRWNRWRVRRRGRKRNNSGKNDLEPVSHSGRVLERSFSTSFWDRNCWKVKNLLICWKATRKFLNDDGRLITALESISWSKNWVLLTMSWNKGNKILGFCRKRCNLWPITDVSLATR